jgi:hypothetical protein
MLFQYLCSRLALFVAYLFIFVNFHIFIEGLLIHILMIVIIEIGDRILGFIMMSFIWQLIVIFLGIVTLIIVFIFMISIVSMLINDH